jgi:hypothetical protein
MGVPTHIPPARRLPRGCSHSRMCKVTVYEKFRLEGGLTFCPPLRLFRSEHRATPAGPPGPALVSRGRQTAQEGEQRGAILTGVTAALGRVALGLGGASWGRRLTASTSKAPTPGADSTLAPTPYSALGRTGTVWNLDIAQICPCSLAQQRAAGTHRSALLPEPARHHSRCDSLLSAFPKGGERPCCTLIIQHTTSSICLSRRQW